MFFATFVYRRSAASRSAQQWGQGSSGGVVVECFAGSGVESEGDVVEVALGDVGEGSAFGEVSAQEAV